MREARQYDNEFKTQALKLAKEIGNVKAANELGISKNTLYGWIKAAREGRLDAGPGYRTPGESMTLSEENQALRKRIKELEKKNRDLEELNEFLEEASAFFAASRRKSGKTKD
jgi:transposase